MKKSEDFKTSGKWSVTTRDVATGQTEDHVFDAVMLCTGHHADKNVPDFPGISEYTLKLQSPVFLTIHSLKLTELYNNKLQKVNFNASVMTYCFPCSITIITFKLVIRVSCFIDCNTGNHNY